MMQPKRILTALLVVVLLTFCSLTVFAAEPTAPTLGFAVSSKCDTAVLGEDGSYALNKGDVVEFTVSVDAYTGSLPAMMATVKFDPEFLELKSAELSSAYADSSTVGDLYPEGDMFDINCIMGYKGAGKIATFSFVVLDAHGDASVTVEAVAYDANWKPVPTEVKNDVTAIKVHSYGEEKTTDPDCFNGGETYRICTVADCSAKLVLKTTEALGHDYSGPDADCTNDKVCARGCGTVLVPAGHDYSGPDADCTNDKVCAREGCGVVLAPKLGHDETGAPADCTNDKVCAREGCGVVLAPKLGHDETGPDADCTNDKFCAREGCGVQLKVRLGHDYSGAAATCTTAQVCVRTGCGEVLVAALGHKAGAVADCLNAQVCERCDVVVTPALGHDESSEATCTGDKLCARPGCGVKLGDKLGHDESGEAATCKAAKKCPRCGIVLEKKLEEHSFGEWTVTEEPTMSKEGKQTRTCSICGEVEEEKLDKKSSAWLIILIIVLVLALAGGGFAAYWFLVKNKKADTESEETTNEDSEEAPEEVTEEKTEE